MTGVDGESGSIHVTEEPGKVILTIYQGPDDEGVDAVLDIPNAEALIRYLKLSVFRAQGFDQGGALATLPEQ